MTTNPKDDPIPSNDPIPQNDHGRFVWHDLVTKDVDKAIGFYSELLGWTVKEVAMEKHTYHHIMVGDTGIGGMVSLPTPEVPPHFISYVSVADVAATTTKASSLGAKVCVPPTSIPNIGEFSVISDPQGGVISTFKHLQPKAPLHYKDLKPGMACWNELWTTDPEAASKFYGELFGWTARPENMALQAKWMNSEC